MAACPVCHRTIEIQDQHMGALFTCPHCTANFFIGWDGQPEVMVAHQNSADMTPAETPHIMEDVAIQPVAFEPMEGAVENFQPPYHDQVESDSQDQFLSPVSEEEPAAAVQPMATPMKKRTSAPPLESAPSTVTNDFSDVSNFANSESAPGPLSYSVRIRGIELAETFKLIREAVTDSRFGWDAEEVMGKISGGELVLRRMNPTKASLLVSRIKFFPVEVDWNQEIFNA